MDLVQIEAGASYEGLVTDVEDAGLWVTEDDVTEEFIAYADVTEAKIIYRLEKGLHNNEK